MRNEVNKCPACGALRPALSAQCPECGYDFQHTTCKVVEELNGKFGLIDSEKQKLELIRSFAIPQVKEEILDLLIYIQPKATGRNSKVTAEWRLRQKELIQRAKMAFSNDRKVLAQVQEYENELRRIERHVVRQWWQKISILVKIAIVLAALLLLILLIPAKDVSPEAYSVRFAEAVEQGKYDKALNCLDKSPQMGGLISDQYLSLIDALFAEARFVEAENLFNNRSQYVSFKDNARHLSATSCLFVQHYIDQQYYDMADKFVVDAAGATLVLKALIADGDPVVAARYFRKNSRKLTTYSPTEKKFVLNVNDEAVEKFATENNLIR